MSPSRPQAAKCVCLNVTSLAKRRPVGMLEQPRLVSWLFDTTDRMRVALHHDGKAYELDLLPHGHFGTWCVNCPTCGSRCMKLWLAPHRYVFQCRLCAGVQTWHRTQDKELASIGEIARRVSNLRRRHAPVARRPSLTWYRGMAKIVALEDRLVELAGAYVEAK